MKDLYNTWISKANECHEAHINYIYNQSSDNKATLRTAIKEADDARIAYLEGMSTNQDMRLAA